MPSAPSGLVVFENNYGFRSECGHSCAWICHSASLMPPFWNLGKPFWQLGGTRGKRSSRRDTIESRIDILSISRTPFRELSHHIGATLVFLFPCSFLMIFLSESGRVGLEKQVFGRRVCKKTCFRKCRDSVDFRSIFCKFLVALGLTFMIFGVSETGLNFNDFSVSGLPWSLPRTWDRAQIVVI